MTVSNIIYSILTSDEHRVLVAKKHNIFPMQQQQMVGKTTSAVLLAENKAVPNKKKRRKDVMIHTTSGGDHRRRRSTSKVVRSSEIKNRKRRLNEKNEVASMRNRVEDLESEILKLKNFLSARNRIASLVRPSSIGSVCLVKPSSIGGSVCLPPALPRSLNIISEEDHPIIVSPSICTSSSMIVASSSDNHLLHDQKKTNELFETDTNCLNKENFKPINCDDLRSIDVYISEFKGFPIYQKTNLLRKELWELNRRHLITLEIGEKKIIQPYLEVCKTMFYNGISFDQVQALVNAAFWEHVKSLSILQELIIDHEESNELGHHTKLSVLSSNLNEFILNTPLSKMFVHWGTSKPSLTMLWEVSDDSGCLLAEEQEYMGSFGTMISFVTNSVQQAKCETVSNSIVNSLHEKIDKTLSNVYGNYVS